MPEPFKDQISPAAVEKIAAGVCAAWPAFPAADFAAAAASGLPALELKGRVAHVADALRAHLPSDWAQAAGLLLAASGPALPDTSSVSQGFWVWPLLAVVERHGVHAPTISLPLLRQLTRRFSAEFAIRPFLIHHPELTWQALGHWAEDPDAHVRRLASEGSRPRLPWGVQLKASIADPRRGLALLERLKDDPERYVQRSVANHLNDVSRDHPDIAAAAAARWLVDAPPARAWVVRHALRSLLKSGHPGALAALGFLPPRLTLHSLFVSPPALPLGGAVTLTAQLTAHADQKLMLDVVLGLVRARGRWGEKVFKGAVRTVEAGERLVFTKTLPLKPVTTRRHYPGKHSLTLQINGRAAGTVHFMLQTGG